MELITWSEDCYACPSREGVVCHQGAFNRLLGQIMRLPAECQVKWPTRIDEKGWQLAGMTNVSSQVEANCG
jgi:hypothetical protein